MTKQQWRLLVTVIFSYHLIAIIVYSLPGQWKSSPLRMPFRSYISLIGQHQGFNMMVGHYPLPSITFTLVAQNESGQQKTFGALLPGLRDFGNGSVRLRKQFSRMLTNDKRDQLSLMGYVTNACQEIAETAFKPKMVYLRMTGRRNNTLEEIRGGAPVERPTVKVKGPFACD